LIQDLRSLRFFGCWLGFVFPLMFFIQGSSCGRPCSAAGVMVYTFTVDFDFIPPMALFPIAGSSTKSPLLPLFPILSLAPLSFCCSGRLNKVRLVRAVPPRVGIRAPRGFGRGARLFLASPSPFLVSLEVGVAQKAADGQTLALFQLYRCNNFPLTLVQWGNLTVFSIAC